MSSHGVTYTVADTDIITDCECRPKTRRIPQEQHTLQQVLIEECNSLKRCYRLHECFYAFGLLRIAFQEHLKQAMNVVSK